LFAYAKGGKMTFNRSDVAAQSGAGAGQGALAGSIATFPMTVFMLATQRLLPKHQQYELPPEILVREFSQRAHLDWHLDKRLLLGATLISHFGYGAVMGTLYSFLCKKKLLPAPWQGMLFGLLVWVGSYLGLLPITRFSPTAPREPARRNLLMIGAHIIWGTALGWATRGLMSRGNGQKFF
jgi:uncharacterized membrane protein YagU involved in acid resistance